MAECSGLAVDHCCWPPVAFASNGDAFGSFRGLVAGVEVAEQWTWAVRRSPTG